MSHWEKRKYIAVLEFISFMQRIRMHFPTKVISKLKVFSCQILRNTVGKDTKAFHSFINDNAHWSVNNLKKKKWRLLSYFTNLSIHHYRTGFSLMDYHTSMMFIPRKSFSLGGKTNNWSYEVMLNTCPFGIHLWTQWKEIYQVCL